MVLVLVAETIVSKCISISLKTRKVHVGFFSSLVVLMEMRVVEIVAVIIELNSISVVGLDRATRR
jgi:hypothetical protein